MQTNATLYCMLLRVIGRFCAKCETGQTSVTRRVAQWCWIRLYSSSNIVGATQALYIWSPKYYGLYPSIMHCRFSHCWELLHPFVRHYQHGRNNSQHYWPNINGTCCVRLLVALRLLCTQLANVEPLGNRSEFWNHICLRFCVSHTATET